MLWLGHWQFHRAESGNALSWGYTFEWPLFAAFALVFYVRTVLDEVRGRRGAKAAPAEASTVQASTGDPAARPARTAPGRPGRRRGSTGPGA